MKTWHMFSKVNEQAMSQAMSTWCGYKKSFNSVSSFFRTLTWGGGLGGLSWSSVAVCLSPWCTELPVFLAAPGMSTHSCIILWPTVAAVDAVTQIHTTASAPVKSLMTNAPQKLATWGTRTSIPWHIQCIHLENENYLMFPLLCVSVLHPCLIFHWQLNSVKHTFIVLLNINCITCVLIVYCVQLQWIHGIHECTICAFPHQTRSNFCPCAQFERKVMPWIWVSGPDTQYKISCCVNMNIEIWRKKGCCWLGLEHQLHSS